MKFTFLWRVATDERRGMKRHLRGAICGKFVLRRHLHDEGEHKTFAYIMRFYVAQDEPFVVINVSPF